MSAAPEPTSPAPLPAPPAGYAPFLVGSSSWLFAFAMQQVLFSWMVVNDLEAPAEQVGGAQLALMAPTVLMLLVSGVIADRVDRRRLLCLLYGVGGLAMLALAQIVHSGRLSMGFLVAYALVLGVLNGFIAPARDSMLSEVAGANLLRAVTGMTIGQFVAQFVGQLTAGMARWTGTPAALVVQACFALAAIAAMLGVPVGRPPAPAPVPGGVGGAAPLAGRPGLADFGAGLVEVFKSPVMRPVLLLSASIGLFFMGSYTVLFPLMVRDVYSGTVMHLGALQAMFPAGSVVGSIVILRRGRVQRRGLALLVAQGLAGLTLLGLALDVPFPVALALVLAWGLCGGVFMNVSRTVFQETASAAHRARVLAVFSLGFMAAGTLGSLAAGYLAAGLGGPLGALAANGGAMLMFVAVMATTTRVLEVRAP